MKKPKKLTHEIIAEFQCGRHPNKKSTEDVGACIYNGPPLCEVCEDEMTLVDFYRKVDD